MLFSPICICYYCSALLPPHTSLIENLLREMRFGQFLLKLRLLQTSKINIHIFQAEGAETEKNIRVSNEGASCQEKHQMCNPIIFISFAGLLANFGHVILSNLSPQHRKISEGLKIYILKNNFPCILGERQVLGG